MEDYWSFFNTFQLWNYGRLQSIVLSWGGKHHIYLIGHGRHRHVYHFLYTHRFSSLATTKTHISIHYGRILFIYTSMPQYLKYAATIYCVHYLICVIYKSVRSQLFALSKLMLFIWLFFVTVTENATRFEISGTYLSIKIEMISIVYNLQLIYHSSYHF